ncbi:hypothetical protein L3I75_000493 [Vibrio vulnificus]|uniref:hypothetical protein n=1 Tax=Vibrio vulnificus TaxID=672 RepID=UPI001302D8E4|nr:hypothetical protein [Vibrio vulnificus]EIU7611523.1 hypothetical protein [Vibrio vulnificus]EIU7861419.1 hypothetical protein [Vibrio vulnificus]EJE8577725.1 hypothetical protein [Vibrio vulnificus]MCU8204276.1 hypothetical protein [Vibrio vulnificus]HAS8421484.1 hypothetical protein [Vibrio vulnificus]
MLTTFKNFTLKVADNLFVSLLQSLVIATIPIFYFASKDGEVAGDLIEALMPLNQYYKFTLCSVIAVWGLSYCYKLAKKYRKKVRQSSDAEATKKDIQDAQKQVTALRKFTFELARCANVLSDTFIGLASAMAGVYIALGTKAMYTPELALITSPFCFFSDAAKFILVTALALAFSDVMRFRRES